METLTQQLADIKSNTTEQSDGKNVEIENLKAAEQLLNEKVINLKNELTLRDAIIANYDGELKELISDKEVLDKRCQEILGAETVLKNQLNEKCDELQVLKYTEIAITDENGKLLKRQEELELKITEQNSIVENVQKVLDTKTAMCAEFKQTQTKLQKELENNRKMLTENVSTISNLQSESNDLKSKLNENVDNLKKSELQRQELMESLKNDKDTVVSELNQNIEKLRTDISELAKEKLNLEIELKAQSNLVAAQLSTIEQLKTKYTNISTENNNFIKEIEALKQVACQKDETLHSLDEKFNSLSSIHENSQSELKQIKEQCVAKDETINLLQQNIAQFETEISNIQAAQSNDSAQSNEKIQQLSHDLETVKAERDNLAKQIELTEKNLFENQEALNTSTGQFQETSTQLSDALFKIGKLKNDLMTKEEESDKVSKQNKELCEKLESLNQREIDSRNQLAKLEMDHANCGKLQSDALQKATQLENDLVAKATDIDKYLKQNEDLAAKLDSESKREAEIQTQLSKLEVEHADIGRKMVMLEQKVEQVRLIFFSLFPSFLIQIDSRLMKKNKRFNKPSKPYKTPHRTQAPKLSD